MQTGGARWKQRLGGGVEELFEAAVSSVEPTTT